MYYRLFFLLSERYILTVMPPQFRKNSRSRMFKLNILAKMCKDNLHFF